MLNQRDRRQLNALARQITEDDPALAEAFENWRMPPPESPSPELSRTRTTQPDNHRITGRFSAAMSLRRWWGALFVVCGLALVVLTAVGVTLKAWTIVAISLAALGTVFGVAALCFWLSYRNAVSDRRRRRS
ncbi:hypothetical protein [Haloechinothrix salitolerans]|uniref:DUF3040 domain-containing protein n=1 Tax=Haloechinothrix salitolerans TaxID=926830 RepID=A0ABW2C0Q3_9PSEU